MRGMGTNDNRTEVFRVAYTDHDGSRVLLGETFLNRAHAEGRIELLPADHFGSPSVVTLPIEEDGIKIIGEGRDRA